LVRYRRQGRKIFYALDDEHVRELIEIGREHVEEEKR
jgi:ArsR family transcriptional regulator